MRSYADPSAITQRMPSSTGDLQGYIAASQHYTGMVDKVRQRRIEDERLAQQKEMQDMQMAQLKSQQYEALIVPPDSGIKSADEYINNASRSLVDSQALLVQGLQNGDISSDEFAQRSALIKSQVPALKQTKEELVKFQTDYQTLLENGSISKADDGQAAKLYQSIADGTMQITPDEEGNMMMVDEAQGISVPLTNISRIPKPIPKAQPISMLAKEPLKIIGDQPWGPESTEQVRQFVDGMFTGDPIKDGNNLKAIACDDLGMSLDKANELLNTPAPEDNDSGATNMLEMEVENAIMDAVKTQYDAKEIQRQMDQQKLVNEQLRAQQYEANIRKINNDVNLKNKAFNTSQGDAGNRQRFANAVQDKDLSMLVGMHGAADIQTDPKNSRRQVLVDKQGKPILMVDFGNPQAAYDAMLNFSKGNVNEQYQDPHEGIHPDYSPTKKTLTEEQKLQMLRDRQSPMKASRGARKAAQNKATKAAHAQSRSDRHAEWDRQRKDEKVGLGDVAQAAAGAIPFVGGALVAKDLAKGAAVSVGSDIGASGDFGEVAGKVGKKVLKKGVGKGLKAAGAVAGQVAGIVGAADAAYSAAQKSNQLQRQNMSDEEYENYKRTGSTTGRRRAKRR